MERVEHIARVPAAEHIDYIRQVILHIKGKHDKCQKFEFESCNQFACVEKKEQEQKLDDAEIFMITKLDRFSKPGRTMHVESFNGLVLIY